MNLTAENVQAVFLDCLFGEKTDRSTAVLVDGIVSKFGFDPQKLADHKQDIRDMLEGLPDEFQAEKGGGYTFLNGCLTKEGTTWTGLHRSVEQLMCLGIGTDQAMVLMPRDMWAALPGGLPYFVVKKPS